MTLILYSALDTWGLMNSTSSPHCPNHEAIQPVASLLWTCLQGIVGAIARRQYRPTGAYRPSTAQAHLERALSLLSGLFARSGLILVLPQIQGWPALNLTPRTLCPSQVARLLHVRSSEASRIDARRYPFKIISKLARYPDHHECPTKLLRRQVHLVGNLGPALLVNLGTGLRSRPVWRLR
jgi:hypothetical protein